MKDIFVSHLIANEDRTVAHVDCEVDETMKNETAYKIFGKKLTNTDRKEWTTETIIKTSGSRIA